MKPFGCLKINAGMMKYILLFTLLLFTACSQFDRSDCIGEWVLKQETTSVGSPLTLRSNTLVMHKDGSYELEELGKNAGKWFLMESSETKFPFIVFEEPAGIFTTYVIDSLSTHQLILRNGFGRRLIYMKKSTK